VSEKITLQKIFDLAWEHFIVGDGKPAVEDGNCRYLTSDGRKCAIGLSLPDGHESQSHQLFFDDLVKQFPKLFKLGNKIDFSNPKTSLNKFQYRLHDSLINAETFEWSYSKEFRMGIYIKVANDYGLKVPGTEASTKKRGRPKKEPIVIQ